MRILALEASATAASAAVCQEDKVIGEYFLHTGKTHSQTLLPMVEQLLTATDSRLEDLDFLAVSTGPGSFTGLRIAIAAVKGMAMGSDRLCVGVSSLEALAYNLRGFQGVAAAVMDARCGQVYMALFDLADGEVVRRCPDTALTIAELGAILATERKTIFFVGDGAELCYTTLLDRLSLLEAPPTVCLAPPHLRLQRAASVAAAALAQYRLNGAMGCAELLPDYLRLPQAERELLQKNLAHSTPLILNAD